MKAKLLIAVSVVALLVAAMAVGIYAETVKEDYDVLATRSSTVRIYGYLYHSSSGYTTPTGGTADYQAKTTTSQAISEEGVQEISARVLHSAGVTCRTIGEDEVYAYGDVAASTHEAKSTVDEVYFLLQ